ncbi:MAG: hypothetical protein AAF236_02325 [Verrucomicrobiota bacterium]
MDKLSSRLACCGGLGLIALLAAAGLGAGWFFSLEKPATAASIEAESVAEQGIETVTSREPRKTETVGESAEDIPSTADGISQPDAPRTWTSTDGKELRASFVSQDDLDVLIRVVPEDRVYRLPKTRLSAEDQAHLASIDEEAGYPMPTPIPDRWPAFLDTRSRSGPTHSAGGSFFQAGQFDIESQGDVDPDDAALMVTICAAMDQVVRSVPLPLQWGRPADERREVFLHNTSASYREAGGPPNSAGFYSIDSREVHVFVPALEGLDLRREFGLFQLAQRKSYTLLVHELTHQLTPVLTHSDGPAWIPEGIAEYFSATQSIPGRFEFKNTLTRARDYVSNSALDTDGIVEVRRLELWPIEEFSERGLREWNETVFDGKGGDGWRQYSQALILTEFFIHGYNNSLRPYLEAVLTGSDWENAAGSILYRGESAAALQNQIQRRWKGVGVDLVFTRSPSTKTEDFELGIGLDSRL